MEKHTNEQIITVDQVAIMLKVTGATVRRWARTGQLPGFKIGKSWFFNKSNIEGNVQGMGQASKILSVLGKVSKSETNDYDINLGSGKLNLRVEVKTSKLYTNKSSNFWRFSNLHSSKKNDYFLLIGYDGARNNVLASFFIPSKEFEKYVLFKKKDKVTDIEYSGISIEENDQFMKGYRL